MLFGKGAAKASAPGAAIIHFLGGIHEIYFPYVLMKPIMIIAAIAGGASGVLMNVLFNGGLRSPAAPGSIVVIRDEEWLVTSAAAIDTDLGVLKTGKEADVILLQRAVPGEPASNCLLAAKRYRNSEHRMFHRDAGYTEGRRVRNSRDSRALAAGTAYGRSVAAGLWAAAEWAALNRLFTAGVPVPYPSS